MIMESATNFAEGEVKLNFGGACGNTRIHAVNLGLLVEDPKNKWQMEISELGEDSTVMFTDGSMKENGEQEQDGGTKIGGRVLG